MVRLDSWRASLAKALVIVDRGVVMPPPVVCCGIESFDITMHSWSFEVRTTNPASFICQLPWICQGGGYSRTADNFIMTGPTVCSWRYFPPEGVGCNIDCNFPQITQTVITSGGFTGSDVILFWAGGTACQDGSFEQNWQVDARVPMPNEGPPNYCPLPPSGPIEFDATNFTLPATTCDINTGNGVTITMTGLNSVSIDAINYL